MRISLDSADDGRTLVATVGDLLVVTLEEAPTSGYRWQIERIDQPMLQPAGDEFRPPSGGRLGGQGRRRLSFTVATTGTALLRLVLRRAGAPVGPPERSFEATVRADA